MTTDWKHAVEVYEANERAAAAELEEVKRIARETILRARETAAKAKAAASYARACAAAEA